MGRPNLRFRKEIRRNRAISRAICNMTLHFMEKHTPTMIDLMASRLVGIKPDKRMDFMRHSAGIPKDDHSRDAILSKCLNVIEHESAKIGVRVS